MTIIEADGTDLKKYTVDRLTVHVGQRYSVIVEAKQQPQNYHMRAELDRECFFTPGVLTVPELPKAIGVVRYENGTDTFDNSVHHDSGDRHCQDMDPKILENFYPRSAPRYDQTFTLAMRFGKNKDNRLRGKQAFLPLNVMT
jgi:FtsP/CotA-like multicopper oxidase with cupredoxin domain